MCVVDKNLLCFGDNLRMLREKVADESVDLVYLDPPFNSKTIHNVLFSDKGGRSAAQLQAFNDTWVWGHKANDALTAVVEGGGKVSQAMQAFRGLLPPPNGMLAYLSMMAPRLIELNRVMRPNASIYLHCDPTASHYLKLLMDSIFGADNFRNEIIWKRTTAHSSAKKWAPIHDTLLYYSKSRTTIWNDPRTDYDDAYLAKYYRFDDGDGLTYWRNSLTAAGIRNGSSGLPWRGFDVAASGQHWKFTRDRLDELDTEGLIYWPPGGKGFPQIKRYRRDLKGKAVPDIWNDIDRINPRARERLPYSTQKPKALLDRIISASTDKEDVVLDPFCGCGSTIYSAQQLGRHWIGIDITHLAISLIRDQLAIDHGLPIRKTYDVYGEPVDLAGAKDLALSDRFQFQAWAVSLVGWSPLRGAIKKGRDGGVDGRMYFHDEGPGGPTKQIVISVKSGHTSLNHVRELIGVLDQEGASIGALISLQEPTLAMRGLADSAGRYAAQTWLPSRCGRVQLLSIEGLLSGRERLQFPTDQARDRGACYRVQSKRGLRKGDDLGTREFPRRVRMEQPARV